MGLIYILISANTYPQRCAHTCLDELQRTFVNKCLDATREPERTLGNPGRLSERFQDRSGREKHSRKPFSKRNVNREPRRTSENPGRFSGRFRDRSWRWRSCWKPFSRRNVAREPQRTSENPGRFRDRNSWRHFTNLYPRSKNPYSYTGWGILESPRNTRKS